MVTIAQLFKFPRTNKIRSSRVPALQKCPQKKGVILRVFIITPRKPNSALRKIVKARLLSNRKTVIAYIPGQGHNLQKYSTILMRGGGVKDLPGVKYHLIRGVLDLASSRYKVNARSKYGVKRIKKKKKL